MTTETPTRYLLKPTDALAIKVGDKGFGSFVFGGVDISNAVAGATVTFEAGHITKVTFTCVPGAVTLEADAAEITVNVSSDAS